MVLTDFMFKILVRNPNSQQTLFVIVSEEFLMIYTIKKSATVKISKRRVYVPKFRTYNGLCFLGFS